MLDRDGSAEEAVLEINSDITERKLAIQRLKDSDARTTAILDAAADAILTIDERGQIESLNPAAERLFGFPTAELIGQNIKMLMPEPYHGEHDGYLYQLPEHGPEEIIGSGRTSRPSQGRDDVPDALAVSELAPGQTGGCSPGSPATSPSRRRSRRRSALPATPRWRPPGPRATSWPT